MFYLGVAIGAYILNAIAATIDKILLSKDIPDPRVYTFFIALLGSFGIVLAPWGMTLIPFHIFFIALVAGFVSVGALWSFFQALVREEASRVVPIVGGLQPIIIFLLATSFLGEQLGLKEILAVIVLILGGVVITYDKQTKSKKQKSWIVFAVVSGLLFGCLYFLNKYLFNELGFINGFVWPRLTTAAAALFFLITPGFIQSLKNSNKQKKTKSGLLFLLGQTCGALFFILINYAISLGSVTIVNALQGVQYVFVFLFVVLISLLSPRSIHENITKTVLLQKLFAILMISFGIVLLIL